MILSISGKPYVGSSNNIKNRWQNHRSMLNRSIHYNSHLQKAWNKYGKEGFTWKVLEECEREFLVEREQYWIDRFDAYKNGYNQRPIANSPKGMKLSDEQKEKIKQGMSSESIRKKLSENAKARKHSKDRKEKISQSLMGIHRSDETKERMRKAAKLRVITPEHRAKIAQNRKGKRHSAEARAKISEALRNRPPISEETRNKLRFAARNRPKALKA